MGAVVARALDLLRTADAASRRDDLTRLAREAVMRLGAPALEIVVAPEDAAVADSGWAADLQAATGVSVTVVASAEVTGGCIARTMDGRLCYDNTLTARLRRLEAAWRPALNELIEVRS
jgi:vacuolar-type H+-ATPase subunit E/Vma4